MGAVLIPIVLTRKSGHVIRNIRISLVFMLLFTLALPVSAGDKEKDEDTLKDAAIVLREMLTNKNLPRDVVAKAYCIIVLPNVKKFAVGFSGTGGRGPLVCRSGEAFNGNWSAPAMYGVGGFNAGFQLGGPSTDLVLLVNE
jgi:SH3 domain-containing YSC84-like protein 1